MIISGHQPVYLPSIQLFTKIALSDVFMFLGHCQFVNQSWHSRNIIRCGKGNLTLSVPIKKAGQFGQSITDAHISGDHWKRKHLVSIHDNYIKAPYYDKYFSEMENIIMRPWKRLGAMNMALIVRYLNWLEIDTPILISQDYDIVGQKNDMLISMCRAANVDKYLSNIGSESYVNEKYLEDNNVDHYWLKYKNIPYDQPKHFSLDGRYTKGQFMENLSIIDLLFNMGPKSRDIILASGSISKNKEE